MTRRGEAILEMTVAEFKKALERVLDEAIVLVYDSEYCEHIEVNRLILGECYLAKKGPYRGQHYPGVFLPTGKTLRDIYAEEEAREMCDLTKPISAVSIERA